MAATTLLCIQVILISLCAVHSATITRNEDIQSAIDNVQKQIINSPEIRPKIITPSKTKIEEKAASPKDLIVDESTRRHKMLDFFGYFPQQPQIMPGYPTAFYPQNYYDEYNAINDEDDVMSRANRRKPASNQNSPIFYIRLPPTPYMFVPGTGYISQPPTYQPLGTPQYQMPQHLPPPQPIQHVNPFLNLPINFLANGKPSNVYQWNAAPPSVGHGFGPQYPSYLPSRPQHRPSYRPHKPTYGHQDSKITHLKGPFVFNGRPEDIFILPNSPYHVPYSSTQYNNNDYSDNQSSHHSRPSYNHMQYNTPYNSPYMDSLYPEPMQNYY